MVVARRRQAVAVRRKDRTRGEFVTEELDFDAIRNLPALFFEQAERYGAADFLSAKREGAWRALSWTEVAERVTQLAAGLKGLGIASGDRVMIVAENRPEWLIADLAILSIGAITTPAYTTNTPGDHLHILTDSGAKAAFVSTPALAKRLLPAAAEAPALETVIGIDTDMPEAPEGVAMRSWEQVTAAAYDGDIREAVAGIARSDPACIIYTSGTSGKPKGVILSHGAILCNCMGAYHFLEGLPGFALGRESFLSFLPLSHSYEHTCGQFLPMALGAEIFYAEGLDKLVANMAEVRPSIMPAVPRLYEAIRGRIYRGVEQAGGLKEKMFKCAIALGRKRYEQGRLGPLDALQDAVLEKLVRDKVRARFGGRLKAFVSGGAALNYDVGLDFLALGLRILQGYGQTESAPVVSCNLPHKNKLHTVGPPLEGVEVRIADDGEILVRGELVMDGYWNLPAETAETIKDGWLHTGDIGVLDEDGYIQITDRKKDIIVNSGGDNIAPARIEGMLTAEPEIHQAMAYGDKHPHLVALVVPDTDFAAAWAREHGKSDDLAALIEDKDFIDAIGAAVDRVNKSLSVIERVRRTILLAESFTIENEMMTPTLKLRRHVIRGRYGDALEALY
jgi:long-chain acyl-CoA synthetase